MVFALLAGCAAEVVLLHDEMNHTTEREMFLPVVSVDSTVDLVFDPGRVRSDLRCQDVAARDLGVYVIFFPEMTPAELEQALEDGALRQADQQGIIETLLEDCGAVSLSEMSSVSTDGVVASLDHEGTFLAVLFTDAGPWISISILESTEGAGDTAVHFEDGCGQLDIEATIPEAEVRFREPEGVNWGLLTRDGFGRLFQETSVQRAEFAYFSGMSPSDLAADYLWLDTVVSQRWSVPVDTGDLSIDRAALEGLDRFAPGDGDGTWALALFTRDGVPAFLTTITD